MKSKYIQIHSTREKWNENSKGNVSCKECFLYINSFGDVYPCCHQIVSMRIGNISEPNIFDKILNYTPDLKCSCSYVTFTTSESTHNFLNVNLELAGECNGNCVYCFQKSLPTFQKSVTIYNNLEKLLLLLRPKNMMVFGGEVGIQEKTISLLNKLKAECNTTINVATNGNIKKELYNYFDSLFSGIQVTFNGFSVNTVKTLSDLDFEKQISFCEQLNLGHAVSVKYLITPASLLELPLFIKWALNHTFQHVIVDVAYEPSKNYMNDNDWGVSFLSTMKGNYWDDVFNRISKNVKSLLKQKANYIIQHDIIILFSNEIEKRLGLDASFYEDNQLNGQLMPKNVCISHKAWRSLFK